MIKREYLNGFIEYDNRKEERCMRKMRTLFLVLLCCGLSLYAGVSYVNAEEKVITMLICRKQGCQRMRYKSWMSM